VSLSEIVLLHFIQRRMFCVMLIIQQVNRTPWFVAASFCFWLVGRSCLSLWQFVVHSNLGKVVKEVVEEFRRNPPILLPSSAARYTHIYCTFSWQHCVADPLSCVCVEMCDELQQYLFVTNGWSVVWKCGNVWRIWH